MAQNKSGANRSLKVAMEGPAPFFEIVVFLTPQLFQNKQR